MTEPSLFTNCTFQGREYLLKLFTTSTSLEMLITDKRTGEEWQCNYDNLFIENLTQKTGNYKQFDIFVTMLKSALLKTSFSVSLDLLTLEDLEAMRIKRFRGHLTCSHSSVGGAQNRRYLIVTYNVEFDRIHYPIPLEYCGPPDPAILQSTILKLEEEIITLKDRNQNGREFVSEKYLLEKRIDELMNENNLLQEEVKHLKKCLGKSQKHEVYTLQKAVTNLENSILSERKSHNKLVEKLRHEKQYLIEEIERMKINERLLKTQLKKVSTVPSRHIGDGEAGVATRKFNSVQVLYKRSPSPLRKNLNGSQSRIKAKSTTPKNNKNEIWEKSNINNKSPRCKSATNNTRSRSSSASSSFRGSPSFCKVQNPPVNSLTASKTCSRHRCRASRSNSATSYDSRSSTNGCKIRSTTPKRGKSSAVHHSQRHDHDFEILEERIQVLQKLLNENIKLHQN